MPAMHVLGSLHQYPNFNVFDFSPELTIKSLRKNYVGLNSQFLSFGESLVEIHLLVIEMKICKLFH
jgi:hypothetical protein